MTRIYFAGAEVETLTRSLLDEGVKSILYSFYYILSMKRENFIERIQQSYPDVKFFLDSGAFTYATKYKDEPAKLPPYHKYVQLFMQYIDHYGHGYDLIAEPDLDVAFKEIKHDKQVAEWRHRMLENFPHLRIMPVYHPWRKNSEWRNYLDDPRVKALAIGGGKYTEGELRRLVVTAQRQHKPVHGFAMTKIQTTLKTVPFDSVDSTSWVMGQKFGVVYIFRRNKFIVLSPENGGKEQRRLFKRYFENIGVNPKKVFDDDVAEVRRANIIAWRMMAERLEYMGKFREERVNKSEERGPVKEREGIITRLFTDERAPQERPQEREPEHEYAREREPDGGRSLERERLFGPRAMARRETDPPVERVRSRSARDLPEAEGRVRSSRYPLERDGIYEE